MNMVMTNEFNHDYLKKLIERKAIENELEKLASLHNKNMKHNVYMTKAQALRN